MSSSQPHPAGAPPIRRFRYRHTTCAALPLPRQAGGWLAIDVGWPGTLLEYARAAKPAGVPLDSIAVAMVTHLHPDHAGLLSELQGRGVTCVLFDAQPDAIDALERIIRRSHPDHPLLNRTRLTVLPTAASRDWLQTLGIGGVVIPTPGHSEDSVSLVTDAGEAVIGDLPIPELVMPDDPVTRASWSRLFAAGARQIHPAHHPSFTLEHDPFAGAE